MKNKLFNLKYVKYYNTLHYFKYDENNHISNQFGIRKTREINNNKFGIQFIKYEK